MADFSIKETQLSAPQGAGTGPVQAVQSAGSNLLSNLATMGDIFAKGLGDQKKAEADNRKASAIRDFTRKQTSINDALDSGMSANEASVRSRTAYSASVANSPEYAEDFDKIMKGLKGHTAIGEAVDEVKMVEAQRVKDLDVVRKRGMIVPPGTSRKDEQVYIDAAKVSEGIEQDLARYRADRQEYRTDATFTSGRLAEMDKKQALSSTNTLAATTLGVFKTDVFTYINNVKSGKMTQEEAQMAITGRFSEISGQIAAASGGDSAVAGVYLKPFQELQKLGIDMADPKVSSTNAAAQVKDIIARQQIAILVENPKIQQIVAASQLLGNNAELGLRADREAIKLMAFLGSDDKSVSGSAVPLVGNANVEKSTFDMLKKGLTDVTSKKDVSDPVAYGKQMTTSINNVLEQVGDIGRKSGTTPKQLIETAAFLASSEYGAFASTGKVSAAAAKTASETFNQLYKPTIVDNVRKRLEENLNQTESSYKAGAARSTVSSVIDVKFNGSGISFEAIPTTSMDRAERSGVEARVKSLQSSQNAINQLIHIAAHLDQTTDYRKTWEAHKHEWMPSVFPDPTKLKEGDSIKAKNGKTYKYIGGNFNDIERSYVEVSSGQGK
jgi:hypothetical protein